MALSFIEHSLQPAAVLPSLADMLRVTNTNPATLDAAAEQNPILTIDGDALLTYLTSNLAPGDELLVSGVPGSAPDLDLGSVRVQLVRMLGEGDNGAVCLAKVQEMAGSCLEGCLPGNRLVVMKVPATWLWAQDLQPPAIAFKLAHAALAIKKEFITMRHCSKCPHIVQTFGLGVVQHVNKPGQCIQLPVLLSEFCELGSWEDLLFVDNSPMHSRIKQDPATVWFLMKQVVPALTHMNNLKILHKDVRPSCILLQGSSLGCCAAGAPPDTAFSSLHAAYPFIVKLGGFGCSSWEPIGMCDVKCAKVSAYHAPEVGCHEEGLNISAWADAYALAMSFLVGRTGAPIPFAYLQKPFWNCSYSEACQAAEERLRELPKVYGPSLTARELEFVTKGLQHKLALRWPACIMQESLYITQGP